MVHRTIAICICPLLPKSIQDLKRITVLQSFVYISVFLETTCNTFLKLNVTIEFEGITMNGTVLTDDETKVSVNQR